MTSEKKLLSLALLLALALLGGDAFFLSLTNKKAADAAGLLLEARRFDAERETVASMDRLLKETVEARSLLDSYFVGADDGVRFIEKLESAGKKAGLKVSVSNASVPEKSESLRIDMSGEGTFENTLHFLKLLESIPYKLVVERVNIRTKGEAPSLEEGTLEDGDETRILPAPVWASSFVLVLESYVTDQITAASK